jgi:holo-[acyl-carrier protein] synthase
MIRIHQGVDLVEIAKFEETVNRNDQFLLDLFTEQERTYCQSFENPILHFAGRFAAKEACAKALGTGFSGWGIDHLFQEIEVVSRPSGKPEISLNGWAAKIARRKKIDRPTVSISHTSGYAVASVILLENGSG